METEEDDVSPHNNHFTLPSSWLPQDFTAKQRVVVVAVFGKSTVDSGGCKAAALELMVGRQIFNRDLSRPITVDNDTLTGVEGYYDADRRVIYLHLTGAYDTSALVSSLEKMHQLLQEKGFLMAWSSLKLAYARSLLVLFSVSHLLLLCHPTHVFDISYIHLFRTLDAISRSAWGHRSSRMSTPPSPLRNLELALEDQIYHLLRKSRVITNISANSLFALPNNQAYVYIMEETQEEISATSLINSTLHNLCSTQDSISNDLSQLTLGSSNKNSEVSGSRGSSRSGMFSSSSGWESCASITALSDSSAADSLSSSILSGVATERKRNLEHSFNVFLQQHIDQALGKGFDDNVGRHSGPVFFQVPKASVWFDAVSRIFKFFMNDPSDKDNKAKQVLNSLQNLVETEIQFSDARCAKVLPIAVSAYKDGLPAHYTQLHHQEKLDLALNVLGAQARGPMYDEYVTQLEEACERIWQDGRMGCETLSLTGNTCKHPRHNTTADPDDDSSLPVMAHNSGVVYASFCNCGRRQGQREDSFSIKAANYTFYNQLAENCCNRLDTISFPTFKPSVTDAKAAKVSESESDEMEIDSRPTLNRDSRDNVVDSETPHTPGLSLVGTGLSGSMNSATGTGTAAARIMGDHNHTGSQVVITLTKDDSKVIPKDRGIIRQASTTEYLPGMLNTASPCGLLPRWSSWSLCCLGPSSLYSHNAGICDQPGFLPGTNFLLPWDVTVKIEDRDKWPAIADTLGKKALLLKNKKNRAGDIHEFSVKIFLGVEYECVRGHRFMMATPDRHLKASPSGLVKDNATKIANADMPLYFPCPCSRSGNVVNGQLMRLHVVTPKAPVNVTLSPQVQPGPDACPRYIPQPSSSLPVKLSASAYWVLRLPYVYVGDMGPHYPPDPRQPAPTSFARLHRGCYGISQVTLER